MPQQCLPLQIPRMNSTRTLHSPSGTSPVPSNLFSWATSMPEWVQTMTHGPLACGPFGVGKMNENGQPLLELCVFHNLCITNSFFKTKPQHKVSWRHLCSKHWHQLDLILVRHAAIKNVLHTHSYHSVDCDTDHSLVCCKISLQLKKFHHAKKPGNLHIDVSKMTQPDLIEQFAEAFEAEYDASQSGDTAIEMWETL